MSAYLKSIEHVLPSFAAAKDPLGLAVAAIKAVGEILPVDGVAVYLADPQESSRLALVLSKGLSDPELLRARKDALEGVPERSYRTRQALALDQERGGLCVPCLQGERAVGCLVLYGKAASELSDEAVSALGVVTQLLGICHGLVPGGANGEKEA